MQNIKRGCFQLGQPRFCFIKLYFNNFNAEQRLPFSTWPYKQQYHLVNVFLQHITEQL